MIHEWALESYGVNSATGQRLGRFFFVKTALHSKGSQGHALWHSYIAR